MSRPRIIALGNPHACDDGAALLAVDPMRGETEVVHAGRPGPDLLELLAGDGPVVLVDVTRSGAAPGTVMRLALAQVVDSSVLAASVSSHGFGPAEALRLGQALGRKIPPGFFVGIEGSCFTTGAELSPEVRAALPELSRAVRAAVADVQRSS